MNLMAKFFVAGAEVLIVDRIGGDEKAMHDYKDYEDYEDYQDYQDNC